MTRAEVRARIEEVGIVPAVRVGSSDDALFAAETVYESGIPTAEITMTTPGAIEVISRIARDLPEMIVERAPCSMWTRPAAVWMPARCS